jgi:hypothetical protein
MGWKKPLAIGIGCVAAMVLVPLAIILLLSIIGPMIPRPGPIQTGTPFDRVAPGMTLAEVETLLGPGQQAGAEQVRGAVANGGSGSARRRPRAIRIEEGLDYRRWHSSAGEFYIGFRKGRVTTRVARLR